MRKAIIYCTAALLLFFPAVTVNAQLGVAEAIAQGIKKVIRAVDLKIQRLQNETIWLQNAQKTLENAMSKLRLDEITDWVEKQRSLYAGYFDELWQIKAAIGYYRRVKELVNQQKQLVLEYARARDLISKDNHFTAEEIGYMYKVYSGILNESLRNLDQVVMVATAFTTQMSDARRLAIINSAADDIGRNLDELRQFTTQNRIISLQRAKDQQDIDAVKKLYGLE